MRSTVVCGYAFATAALFYVIQDALDTDPGPIWIVFGFVVGLASATFHTRGGR